MLEILQILGTEAHFCFPDAYRGQCKTDNKPEGLCGGPYLYSQERMKQEDQGQPGLHMEENAILTL